MVSESVVEHEVTSQAVDITVEVAVVFVYWPQAEPKKEMRTSAPKIIVF
jgi:hypothetical protein